MCELEARLARAALLTLTGVGGAGKTRLAIRLARRVLTAYRDGVWLVDLAPVRDPLLVAPLVAAGLGIREQPRRPWLETLVAALRARCLLLVLDNCEHLVQACAQVAETLLHACPELRILATSREPLGTDGEHVWPVPPLSTPEKASALAPAELLAFEAVALFVDRAQAAAPAFELIERNAEAVSEICNRLDGIPLAIELAAARVPVLSVEEIRARLQDRFGLLVANRRTAPPRQKTLRATLAWSYGLLGGREQRLFDRLSVFAGGCTLAAAEAVCGGEGLDVLAQLVAKSLVVVELGGSGDTRYRLLETLGEYARERLAERGETESIRARHAAYFVALAEQAETASWGAEAATWWARLEAEQDNLRSALDWLMASCQVELAQRLGAALVRFWTSGDHMGEGQRWATELLDLPGGHMASLARAKLLNGAGQFAAYRGQYDAGLRNLEDGIGLCRALGEGAALAGGLLRLGELLMWQGKDYAGAQAAAAEGVQVSQAVSHRALQAMNLYVLGALAYAQGDLTTAQARSEEALEWFAASGYVRGLAIAKQTLGRVAYQKGELVQARTLLEDSCDIFRRTAWPWGLALNLAILGWSATDQGDLGRARALFTEALKLHQELGSETRVLDCLEGFAQLAVAEGRPAHALRMASAVAAIRDAARLSEAQSERAALELRLSRARRALGPAQAAAAWESGRSLGLREVVARATIQASGPDMPRRASSKKVGNPPDPFGLTAREHEVAALVAQGHTNRQVATALVIAERTAETHLERIYAKLGIGGRAELAAWVTRHRLTSDYTD